MTTTALQNENGPAEGATSCRASSINPTKDTKMNAHSNITAKASPASEQPDLSGIRDAFEEIWNAIQDLQRETYLLMGDLEQGLAVNRGRVDADGETVTLMFQKRGIDVTQWLAGRVWSNSADLVDKADALYSKIERAVQ